ncbi:MAG: hypothetical protein JJU12_07915 [Chlamydiales bacterium]|nr:hypothetical protein [Chlamydiales bacterium]
MSTIQKKGSVFYASFLVMGMCIGTSFLSIPIMTGISGFIPGILMSVLIWIFATANGLLYAEAAFGNPDGSNLYTISKAFLGRVTALLLSALLLIIMYAYISASLISGASFFTWFSEHFFGFSFSTFTGCALLTLLLGLVAFYGISTASRINFILFVGFIVAFIAAFYQTVEHVEAHQLGQSSWIYIFFSVPILFSSFSFNALVPTLCTYLNREKRKVQLSIVIGVTGTLVVYIFWQWMMVGGLGRTPLWIAFAEGEETSEVFPWIREFPFLIHSLKFILVFAATTTIIGIALALIDFYSDCISLPLEKRVGKKRLLICLLIFLPPLLFVLIFTGTFFPKLINYVTAPLENIFINGLIPIIMIAKARYYFKLPTPHFVPGGGILLFIMGMILFFLISLQWMILLQ